MSTLKQQAPTLFQTGFVLAKGGERDFYSNVDQLAPQQSKVVLIPCARAQASQGGTREAELLASHSNLLLTHHWWRGRAGSFSQSETQVLVTKLIF